MKKYILMRKLNAKSGVLMMKRYLSIQQLSAALVGVMLALPIGLSAQTIVLPEASSSCCTTAFTGACLPASETAVVDYVSPVTGRIWMDRALGASRAVDPADGGNFGDPGTWGCMYQWGRDSDGHDLLYYDTGSSGTLVNGWRTGQSTTDDPGHNQTIATYSVGLGDWRTPSTDSLWQGVSGTNNPCPAGYYVPSLAERAAEGSGVGSWIHITTGGAGQVTHTNDANSIQAVRVISGDRGGIWTSTALSPTSFQAWFVNASGQFNRPKIDALQIRCIKE